jgi:glycosyltransferase involved in cell wall biosynthesis
LKNNNQNIWIINQYTSTPLLGGGGNRSFYFGKEFVKNGFNVTLITSSFSHHSPKRNFKIKKNFFFCKEEDNFELVVVKNIVYNKGDGLLRIWSMFLFFIKLFFLPINKIKPPSYIIVSSISLLPILNALFLKFRFKKKPKIILEIRDIWPLSLIEIGKYSKINPFVLFLGLVEKIGYKHSDYVTSVQPFAYKHIEKIIKRPVKFKHIPNGIHFSSLNEQIEIREDIRNLIPLNKFVIGYTGSLGIANAMFYFIEAANKCQDENLFFVIVGDGNELQKLKASVFKNNVLFIPPISKYEIQSMLSIFDILYLGSKKEKIYEYGISAIKTYEYMYAKKPILRSLKIPGDELIDSGCGISVQSEDSDEILKGINKLKEIGELERLRMGDNGYKFVLEERTFEKLALKYIEIFKELGGQNN